MVGTFLWAYNGHKSQHKISQKILSEMATIMAIGSTVFLTTEGHTPTTIISTLHYVFTKILFLILTMFYFVSGRTQRAKWQKKRSLLFVWMDYAGLYTNDSIQTNFHY